MVELRGWLTEVMSDCNAKDPDWHYTLEVDPVWAEEAGMPLDQLLRAGNVLSALYQPVIPDTKVRRVVGVPNIIIELNSWQASTGPTPEPPEQWGTFNRDCVSEADKTKGVPALWPYDPLHPLPDDDALKPGDYVRMYGSLLHDSPHGDAGPAQWFWSSMCRQASIRFACQVGDTERRLAGVRIAGNRSNDDPENQARWTELHPPDVIDVLEPPPYRRERVWAVLVTAENCLVGPCEEVRLDATLPLPPGPQPENTHLDFLEQIVGTTNYRTITDLPSATAGTNGVRLHVAVQGQPAYGAHGRFYALYRVRWGNGAGPDLERPGNVVIRRSSGASFRPSETWSFGPYYGARGTFFADVTGDRRADAIVVNDHRVTVRRSRVNDFAPNESWTERPYYGSRGTFFADVTADGLADAIVVNDEGVTVRRSRGKDFGPSEGWTEGPYYGDRGTSFADVTGDGRADAIVVNDGGVTVRRSRGNNFGPNETWTREAYYGSRGTFFADVTGDGAADAIVVNDEGVTVRPAAPIFGFFAPHQTWTRGAYYGSRGTFFADATGDGRADAIVVNDHGITVRPSLPVGTFGPNQNWTEEPYYGNQGTFFADVSGDGAADAIVSNEDP